MIDVTEQLLYPNQEEPDLHKEEVREIIEPKIEHALSLLNNSQPNDVFKIAKVTKLPVRTIRRLEAGKSPFVERPKHLNVISFPELKAKEMKNKRVENQSLLLERSQQRLERLKAFEIEKAARREEVSKEYKLRLKKAKIRQAKNMLLAEQEFTPEYIAKICGLQNIDVRRIRKELRKGAII
ncbi:hypothetical protein [Bacillus sp. SG-1]|uniref:hypothetical protein n=1 Tax=Bacillus sp. SG-1 TaxID=161544 RepID=UPI0001543E83|nr:hypothetical protein [Bacillus sp. SG-1]EDL64998.1 hypothetical protein BSG1_14794 [Bacillus sp. SG-1]